MSSKYLKNQFPIYHTNWLNRSAIIDQIERAATDYASGLLLDAGCGAKPYMPLFVSYVTTYLGVDLRVTSHYYGDSGPDSISSILQLPFSDNSFNTVVSFQVLEHVPEPQKMFSEMARVLKKRGYLILMAPQMWHLHEIPHDYFRYTQYGLTYLAQGVGLDIVRIRPISGFWVRAGLVVSYRLSNVLMNRSIGQTKVVKFFRYIFITVSNLIFWGLNRIWPCSNDPINNLLIAQKC